MKKLAIMVNHRYVGEIDATLPGGGSGVFFPRLVGVHIVMTGPEPECAPIFSAPIAIGRVANPRGGTDLQIHFIRGLKPWVAVRLSRRFPFISIQDASDMEMALAVLEEES